MEVRLAVLKHTFAVIRIQDPVQCITMFDRLKLPYSVLVFSHNHNLNILHSIPLTQFSANSIFCHVVIELVYFFPNFKTKVAFAEYIDFITNHFECTVLSSNGAIVEFIPGPTDKIHSNSGFCGENEIFLKEWLTDMRMNCYCKCGTLDWISVRWK